MLGGRIGFGLDAAPLPPTGRLTPLGDAIGQHGLHLERPPCQRAALPGGVLGEGQAATRQGDAHGARGSDGVEELAAADVGVTRRRLGCGRVRATAAPAGTMEFGVFHK